MIKNVHCILLYTCNNRHLGDASPTAREEHVDKYENSKLPEI